jgi:hypothetical protein
MKNLLLILSLITLSFSINQHSVYAVEEVEADAYADVQKDFDLKSNMDKTIDWLEQNKDKIRDTLNIEVVEDLGNGKLKVKRDTPKGVFSWIIQESISKKKDKYVYKAKMIKAISGGMVYSDTYITVTPTKNGSNVHIRMAAGVNNPEVRSRAMTIDFVNHCNKCRRLIESYVD